MALSASGITEIFNCDSDGMDGGTGTLDTDVFKTSTGSLKLKVSQTTSSAIKYDQGGTGGVNMAGNHFGIWFFSAATLDTRANGGCRAYFEDTSGNYKHCYVKGSDNYTGGWNYMVCSYDATGDVTSGTYSSAAHRYCGIVFKTLTKSTSYNVWWDSFHYFSDLVITSGASDAVGMAELASWCDTNGNGLVQQTGTKAFFARAGLVWGDSSGTNSIDFSETGVKIFYEANTYVSSTLYKWNVEGNATGTTNYVAGTKSGTSGISGIDIICEKASNNTTVNFNDSNIDKLHVYGGTFDNVGQVDFPALTGANYECLSTAFNSTGLIYPRSFKIEGNWNIIEPDTDGLSIASDTFNVKDGTIINPGDAGILKTTTGD
ncbi:MAG: hypothetical protein ACXABY_07060, partial [Candidatus Thorarchaeota archaeon]